MSNNSHYGQLVEYAVRRRGVSLTDLAANLGVNRRTIYNWFESPYLKNNIIYRIGISINHDFSVEFPQYFTAEMFSSDKVRASIQPINNDNNSSEWKDKYIDLLEKYNSILASMHTRAQ
jgi:lambda repressor-like predicted transcriptional regulator